MDGKFCTEKHKVWMSYRKKVDFKYHEVKRHWQRDSTNQPSIEPRRHHHKRLVLWNTESTSTDSV